MQMDCVAIPIEYREAYYYSRPKLSSVVGVIRRRILGTTLRKSCEHDAFNQKNKKKKFFIDLRVRIF